MAGIEEGIAQEARQRGAREQIAELDIARVAALQWLLGLLIVALTEQQQPALIDQHSRNRCLAHAKIVVGHRQIVLLLQVGVGERVVAAHLRIICPKV